MAQAGDKPSTPAQRGLPLAFYCNQLRANRYSRSETLRHLTARLTSEDVEVSPPLPPDWHLEFDPEDRLWLMWPGGRRKPKAWWDDIRKEQPQRQGESPGEYARRLHNLMQSATVTKVWPLGTLRRRLYDK